jgi:hypothetical protein
MKVSVINAVNAKASGGCHVHAENRSFIHIRESEQEWQGIISPEDLDCTGGKVRRGGVRCKQREFGFK